MMRGKSFFSFVVAVAVLFSSVGILEARAPEVVSVDMQRLMVESTPGKQAEEHLKKVQQVLQKGFEDLKKAHAKEAEAERNRIYAQGLAVLNRQMDVERQAAMRAVQDVVVEEVEKWRKKNGVLLVVSRSMVIAGDWDKADYTNAILSQVNRRKVKFADLPTVTINKDNKEEKKKGRR
ncbi:hypothetical protein [Mailhella massiliensis]|uniref:OmpH family outer membrane protein n=1 Tax=Mailhella massiliensis TaxID=1903261 RepID=A0A921AVX1_9BACT|nr:hypothetical protein [Mailhella massiliensis]HJD97305.1 hypothetical protein [Mailhella massiliensis]